MVVIETDDQQQDDGQNGQQEQQQDEESSEEENGDDDDDQQEQEDDESDDNGDDNGEDQNGDDNGEEQNGDDNGEVGTDDCTDLTDPNCDFDCRDLSTWPTEWLEEAVEVVQLTNEERQAGAVCRGESMPPVAPLEVNAALEEAARCHTLDMAENDFVGHVGSDGSEFDERIEEAGYDNYRTIGENVAGGQMTPQEAVDAWMGSQTGHCEAIMNGDFEEIGVGVVVRDGYPYWTQKFGAEFD